MTLFPVAPTTRDLLGRCYTPDPIADRCVAALEREGMDLHLGGVFVEPSVGDGAFVRVGRRRWPAAKFVGVDRDPLANGLRQCDEAIVGDWPTVARDVYADAILGNPPFDDPKKGQPHRAKEHVEAAMDCRPDWIGFILPLEYLCLGGWAALRSSARFFWPIPGRVWPRHRGTMFVGWRPRSPPRAAVVRDLP